MVIRCHVHTIIERTAGNSLTQNLLEGRIGRRGSLGKAAPDKLLPPPGLYAVRAECPGFSPEPLPCRLRIGPRRGLSFVRGSLMPENLPVTVYFERKER